MWFISIYTCINIIVTRSIYLNILGDGTMGRYLNNDESLFQQRLMSYCLIHINCLQYSMFNILRSGWPWGPCVEVRHPEWHRGLSCLHWDAFRGFPYCASSYRAKTCRWVKSLLHKEFSIWCPNLLMQCNMGKYNINDLVQDCRSSIANAVEFLQSCTKPSTWYYLKCDNDKC